MPRRKKVVGKSNIKEKKSNAKKLSPEEIAQIEKGNLRKYGVEKCPNCGSLNIVNEHGEVYCKDCGYVIDEGYE